MTTLHLRLDEADHSLADTSVHYVWPENNRLHVTPEPPRAENAFGSFQFETASWAFHADLTRCPGNLCLNGKRIRQADTDLPSTDVSLTLDERPGGSDSRHGYTAPDGFSEWTIGRIGTGAEIQIDDPQVRANHAKLTVDRAGTWWIRAVTGAVYVDGNRTMTAVLTPGQTCVIGQTTVVAAPELIPTSGTTRWPEVDPPPVLSTARGGLALKLTDVTVRREGKALLNKVNLRVDPGEVVAIVGPSGAGKTSLIKVLIGDYPPDEGDYSVGYDNSKRQDIPRRNEIRYVPQSESDDLYPLLKVAETLTYAARFRAAPDSSRQDIQERVDQVIANLGLASKRNDLIGTLSGGERRRVSIGLELVGHPQLLLLDEPTSGLDLGKDREIMRILREVSRTPADTATAAGRTHHCTVLVATHSVAHLQKDYVDRVIVIAGGDIEYDGPPEGALLGRRDWAEKLQGLDKDHLPDTGPGRPPDAREHMLDELSSTGFLIALLRQLKLVERRGWRSAAALLAIPFFGAALAAAASPDGLRKAGMTQVLAILVTAAALTGAALTYHDLVSEQKILQRDWRVGISAMPLILAKVTVFGGISAVLAVVIALPFLLGSSDPPAKAFGVSPKPMLIIALFLVMIASMGLGLVISALSGKLERAVALSTLLAVLQVTLTGSLFEAPLWLQWPAAVLPARLGFAAIGGYSDLNRIRDDAGIYQYPFWHQEETTFWLLLGGMAAVFLVSVTVAICTVEQQWRKKRLLPRNRLYRQK